MVGDEEVYGLVYFLPWDDTGRDPSFRHETSDSTVSGNTRGKTPGCSPSTGPLSGGNGSCPWGTLVFLRSHLLVSFMNARFVGRSHFSWSLVHNQF